VRLVLTVVATGALTLSMRTCDAVASPCPSPLVHALIAIVSLRLATVLSIRERRA
jgi:hypothetical protein